MGGFVGALFTRWGTPWLNLYLTPAQTAVDHGRMRHNLFRLMAALSMAALAVACLALPSMAAVAQDATPPAASSGVSVPALVGLESR